MIDEMDKRTATLSTHVREDEAQLIKWEARDTYNMSVSDLIRKSLSLVGWRRFDFQIETNDLRRLAQELTIFNLRVGFLLDNLSEGNLPEEKIEEFRKQSDELYQYVQAIHNVTLVERHAVRRDAEKYLHEQIDKVLELTKGF